MKTLKVTLVALTLLALGACAQSRPQYPIYGRMAPYLSQELNR
jgi:hypothetical protein